MSKILILQYDRFDIRNELIQWRDKYQVPTYEQVIS